MCEASRQRHDRQNCRRIITEATRRWVQNGVRGQSHGSVQVGGGGSGIENKTSGRNIQNNEEKS